MHLLRSTYSYLDTSGKMCDFHVRTEEATRHVSQYPLRGLSFTRCAFREAQP